MSDFGENVVLQAWNKDSVFWVKSKAKPDARCPIGRCQTFYKLI